MRQEGFGWGFSLLPFPISVYDLHASGAHSCAALGELNAEAGLADAKSGHGVDAGGA